MGISKLLTALLVTLTIGSSDHRVPSATQDPTAQFLPLTRFPQIPRPTPQKESADQLPQAEANLQSQHYDLAETQLQALTKSQAKNPQVWFDLGFAESHMGKNAEAIAAYKKAVELSPKWFEANLNLGLALAKAGSLPEAATALRAATELKPTTGGQQALSNAWFSLAQVLEESTPKESLAAYQKAAELNPTNADALVGAGKLMEAQGDLAAAEKQYLTAAQMGNNSGLEQLLKLYLKQKRFADAESWLQKYLAANPNNAGAQVQLGRILAAEGKTQDAISTLEAANKNAPNPDVSRELAALYLEAKQYDSAAPLLQDLVQKNPADGQLHCDRGSVLLHQHKYPEAEAELLQGLKINPKQDDSYWELAYAAQQNKHYELALRALDARAQKLPETATTYWLRAVSYDSLGAFKPAAQNYKLFLAADGGKSPDEEFKARHRLKAIEH
jgi:tetratricopeptide (TPR) repeat protein